MPNRVLRDTTDSDKINSLSVHAERFFYRLIMKVDDYGCFFADPRILKTHLYPLQLDKVKDSDVARWVSDLVTAGLITVYGSGNKKYLEIENFKQTLRQKNRKFPSQAECKQNASTLRAECKNETKRNESETEIRNETKAPPALVFPFSSERFKEVWNLMVGGEKWKKKTPIALQMSLKKLSEHSEKDAIAMMENTIAGNWQGIFELKNNQNGQSKPRKANEYSAEEYASAVRSVFGGKHPGSQNDA